MAERWLSVARAIRTMPRGRRVRLSDEAVRNGLQGRAPTRYARVVTDSGGYLITVRRDGLKGVESYAAHFIEYRTRSAAQTSSEQKP